MLKWSAVHLWYRISVYNSICVCNICHKYCVQDILERNVKIYNRWVKLGGDYNLPMYLHSCTSQVNPMHVLSYIIFKLCVEYWHSHYSVAHAYTNISSLQRDYNVLKSQLRHHACPILGISTLRVRSLQPTVDTCKEIKTEQVREALGGGGGGNERDARMRMLGGYRVGVLCWCLPLFMIISDILLEQTVCLSLSWSSVVAPV